MQDHYSEPVVRDSSPNTRLISVFENREAIYNFFMTGYEDGIQGEFAGLVKLNFDSPVSYEWFKTVWKNSHPLLYTEDDKPQCPECYEFKEKIKESLRQKDNAQVINTIKYIVFN